MAVAVIDLDEFVVDSSQRAATATEAGGGKIHWPTMFRGDLILSLDTPMPEALEKLNALVSQGLEIWYVTSREEIPAKSATIEWLHRENYPFPDNVVCRPAFHKTVVFKVREVERLHNEHGPVVLFADNSEANRAAVAALNISGLEVVEEL